MFKLNQAALQIDPSEALCVKLAAEDLRRDVLRVTGRELPLSLDGNLTVRTVDTGEWEAYSIRCDGKTLTIQGSDPRGTMWGVYEFSRRFLGVDPLYLWTDQEPARRDNVAIGEIDLSDRPRTYKFRGWFINDEDLIEGMCRGGRPDKTYHFQNDYAPLLSKIVETALRMKQNLLIPCSHLDIENPAEEALVKLITERGLFVSMHHQEPVGVHQFTIDRDYAGTGIENVNYVDDPELYEEIWTRYIHKWAKYDNVIWQLGLRGRGDHPVWHNNDSIPPTTEARGALISHAIQRQMDIVKREYAGHELLSTSTLWMEGMELYKENALTFPKGTIVIQADFAPEQMWGPGYYDTPRNPGTDYGVYYHVAFWGCGPHLVQGNDPEKILYNYKAAVAKGDSTYSVLNVSNIREHLYGIACVAAITWDIERFDLEAFQLDWCRSQFGGKDPEGLAELYREYFRCFYEMDHTLVPGQMRLMDGMCRRVALKLIEIIKTGQFRREDIQNKRLYAFDSADDFIAYYRTAAETGLGRFQALYHKLIRAAEEVPAERRQFFLNNLVVQTEIMMGLYGWVWNLALAAGAKRRVDSTSCEKHLTAAVFSLDKLTSDRHKAALGPWEHWYDGDTLVNVKADVVLTDALLPEGLREYPEMDLYSSKF